jgi:hypothetical protein
MVHVSRTATGVNVSMNVNNQGQVGRVVVPNVDSRGGFISPRVPQAMVPALTDAATRVATHGVRAAVDVSKGLITSIRDKIRGKKRKVVEESDGDDYEEQQDGYDDDDEYAYQGNDW